MNDVTRKAVDLSGLMVQFAKQDWLVQHRRQSKGWLKRALYFFLRPLLSRRYSALPVSGDHQEVRPQVGAGVPGYAPGDPAPLGGQVSP